MDVMPLTACVAAALGYGCVYAAVPSRSALRTRRRVQTVCLSMTGGVLLVSSALVGAIAFGPVLGPLVALTAAVTGGSTLIVVAPWLAPRVPHGRTTSPVARHEHVAPSMKHEWSAGEAWGKATAALIGGAMLFVASLVGVGAVLVRMGMTVQFAAAVAVWIAFLTWPTTAILVLLARNARTAWLGTAVAIMALAAGMCAARVL